MPHFYFPDSIEDDDVREVYLSDISRQERHVRCKFGIAPFLYEGPCAEAAGFYHFEIITNRKWRPKLK